MAKTSSSSIPVTLIPGDGIGPEIVDAVTAILSAAKAPLVWDIQPAGMAAVDSAGEPLPSQTIKSIHQTGLALKGPLTTPVGGGFKSINVTLRQEFGLYANLRPVKSLLAEGRFTNIDIVVVRENLEGFYAAQEHFLPADGSAQGIATCTGYTTRAESRRIINYAFDYALTQGRKKVTIVHKANILKKISGLFLDVGREVAQEYEGRIAMEERIVDACAMQLVMNPWQYDVIVTTNLFGDILSDLTSGLVGGLGMAPGANIGEKAAIFEAVHGSAPDIAGLGKANPIALLLAAELMLLHVGEEKIAAKIKHSIQQVVQDKAALTPDLHGTGTTKTLTESLIDIIKKM